MFFFFWVNDFLGGYVWLSTGYVYKHMGMYSYTYTERSQIDTCVQRDLKETHAYECMYMCMYSYKERSRRDTSKYLWDFLDSDSDTQRLSHSQTPWSNISTRTRRCCPRRADRAHGDTPLISSTQIPTLRDLKPWSNSSRLGRKFSPKRAHRYIFDFHDSDFGRQSGQT
jgi:hypothetical protein